MNVNNSGLTDSLDRIGSNLGGIGDSLERSRKQV